MTESQKNELSVVGQICKAIDHMEGNLAKSLEGTGVSVKRFLTTAKTAIQTHADKDKLEKADRQSLYLAVQKAASDGLMPDNREAALVVYNMNVGSKDKPEWKSVVQYQPMVQGLVKLARNSGEIESLGAYIVYESDKFSYKAGVDDLPNHEADWFGKRGLPIGVWAFVKLKSGEFLDPVMLTKERIDRIATRSKMAKNYNPNEGKDWEEFWKKAAIRNILKYAPRSTALENAMKEDEIKEFDFSSDNITNNQPPPSPVKEAPRTETRAAASIKAKAAEAKPVEPTPPEPAQPVTVDNGTGEVIEGKATPINDDEDLPM